MKKITQISFQPHNLIVILLSIPIILTSVLSTIYPIQAVILSVSLVILLFFILRPELLYYLLVFLLHITSIFFIYQERMHLSLILLSELYALLALLLWFFSRTTNIAKPYPGTSCDMLLMLLVCLSLLSFLWSEDPKNGIYQFLRLFLCLVIFVLTIAIINNHRILNIVIWLVIAMGVFNSIFCFLSIYSYPDYTSLLIDYKYYSFWLIFNDPGAVGRRGHAFAHPLTTAYWLNISMILSLGKLITIKGNKKIIMGILIFFMLTAHLTTLSKAPLVALIGGIIFLFYFIRPIRKAFFSALTILLIVLITSFALANITELKNVMRYTTHQVTGHDESSSTTARLNWWKQSIEKCVENYGFGVGIGGLQMHLKPYTVHPHNAYLSVFGEIGFIGLGLFVLIYFFAFKSYIAALRQCKNEYYRRILLSYISGFIIQILYIITDCSYTTNLLWWYFAFGFAIAKLAKESPAAYGEENLPFFKEKKSLCAI
jgi:O-antigen ligase